MIALKLRKCVWEQRFLPGGALAMVCTWKDNLDVGTSDQVIMLVLAEMLV